MEGTCKKEWIKKIMLADLNSGNKWGEKLKARG